MRCCCCYCCFGTAEQPTRAGARRAPASHPVTTGCCFITSLVMSTRLHAGNTHTLMIWAPLKRSNVPRFLGLSLSTMMVVVVVHNFSISWAVLFGTLCQITDEQVRWGQMQEHQLFDLILCKMRSAADDSWTLSKTRRKISNLAGTKVITCIPKHINWVLRIT